MFIKSVRIEQFKGIADAFYEFRDKTSILGKNGAGKTTIADAIYFVLLNKNYQLKDNPEIRNFSLEESIPTVTLVIDFDGKEVEISKQQKCKKSKADENGVQKIAYTNTYTWNSVPVPEKDFKEKFKQEGIDLDLFAELSHPDVFTRGLGDKKQKEHNRETLFGMCDSHTDKEIAALFEETRPLVELLNNYEVNEIEAINKSSYKKANEEIESIPYQIVGLEKAKVDDSEASELELKRQSLVDILSRFDGSTKSLDVQENYMQLEFDKNEYVRKANEDLIKTKRTLENKIFDLETEKKSLLRDINSCEINKSETIMSVQKHNSMIAELQEKWKLVSKEEFMEDFDEKPYQVTEKDKYCKLCGAGLNDEQVEKLIQEVKKKRENAYEYFQNKKNSFEKNKNAKMNRIVDEGKQVAVKRDAAKKSIKEIEQKIFDCRNKIQLIDMSLEEIKTKLSNSADEVDMSNDAKFLEYQTKIEEAKKNIKAAEKAKASAEEKQKATAELELVNKKIAAIANNSEIDEKIQELKDKQITLEQKKADAERILYLLDLLSQKKNTLCETEINSHFKYVNFILFQYLKNGSYQLCCIPTIDGKKFGESMNTGLEIIAKLDICSSLQKFYGLNLPIILDNAESINEEKVPDLDCQLITMRVSEDKEIVVC